MDQMESVHVVTPYAIALYPFKGELDDELSFVPNDIILLTSHVDDNWLEGEIDGKIGIFPANHVVIQIDCNNSESADISCITSESAGSLKASAPKASKRESKLSKSFPTNPFVKDCFDNDIGWNKPPCRNLHSSATWTALFDDGPTLNSVGNRTDPWLSFDSGPDSSNNLKGSSTKKSFLKSYSVPASFAVEKPGGSERKPFILKNKPAPSAPWVVPFSSPSNDPWKVSENLSQPVPKPRPKSCKLSTSASDKSSTPKDNADKLFGEFGYAATKLFRTISINTNNDPSHKEATIGNDVQTLDPTTKLATSPTSDNVARSKSYAAGDDGKLKDIVKAPRPVPRRRTSDNIAVVKEDTTKQNTSGLAPVPAPRRSIQTQSERRNIPVHTPNADKNKNLINHSIHTEEPVRSNRTPLPDNLLQITEKLTPNRDEANVKSTTVIDIENPIIANTEISEDIYSEIVTETADDYYAVIEQSSSENVYTDMPTLNCDSESVADKFKTGKTTIIIPPPPLSNRHKHAQKSVAADTSRVSHSDAGFRGEYGTIENVPIKSPTLLTLKDTEDIIDPINSNSKLETEKSTCEDFYSVPINRSENEENTYEMMWPVQQTTTEIIIPPPLPPKKRPLSFKTWNI